MPNQPRRQFIGLTTSALAGAVLPGPVKRFFAPQTAELTVHLTQSLGEIAPASYGQFIEHLGRAIYGGLYDNQRRRFRPDVLEKVQRLRPPLLRYPGGTVTKIYHWQAGAGKETSFAGWCYHLYDCGARHYPLTSYALTN